MAELHPQQLTFLPIPHARAQEQFDGSLVASPDRCNHCPTRECESGVAREVGLCRYGFNFQRLGSGVTLNGFLLDSWQPSTKAFAKNRRNFRQLHLASQQFNRLVATIEHADTLTEADLERQKKAALDEYRSSDEFERDSVTLLKPEIQQSLAQVHDYRSLVGQIVQNVNVFLDARQPGELERRLDESPRELQAIYWSARLMESKLTAALFLMYPERIRDPAKTKKFRLHGLTTKYEKIYEGAFEDRSVQVYFSGESYGLVRANPDAVGVIPHTFIDNALKYAPSGTEVDIHFSEDDHDITLSVTSLGPLIHPEEFESVFHLYVRGREAARVQREGTGFGLALAKRVADELGISLSVTQAAGPTMPDTYSTTFTATFPKAG